MNASAGITKPDDLVGKRIGLPEFQMTSAVWIRGILQDFHGVPADSVEYLTGGEEQAGREEKQPIRIPPNFRLGAIPKTATLSAMIADGTIDALYTARTPSAYDGLRVKRLFENFGAVEADFWSRTRMFPIMHVIVIRRDVYETNRWIARSLCKAFEQAKQIAYRDLLESGALKIMIPTLPAIMQQVRETMGDDYWPYGIDANRETLARFLRYHHECGLSERLLKPEDLFAPETLETAKI